MQGKTDKCMVVLNMYDALLTGEGIDKRDYLDKYNISVPTFCRYVSIVRRYLADVRGERIIYSRLYKKYYVESSAD